MRDNFHSLIDELTVVLIGLRMRNRYFSDSLETSPFAYRLHSVRLDFNGFNSVGFHKVLAKTLSGLLEAGYIVSQFFDNKVPTIIYHHGSGERPVDFGHMAVNTYKRIFLEPNLDFKANLITICAPFHSSFENYIENISRLDRLMDMVAVSVRLVERLISYLKICYGCSKIVVSGISLGGFVANLHRTYFNSAELYIPILAGADVSDVFINGEFKHITAKKALSDPEYLKSMLRFESEFTRVKSKNLFPLLAKYDRIVILENQIGCYSGHPVNIVDKGHITGSLSAREIRSHIKMALMEGLK